MQGRALWVRYVLHWVLGPDGKLANANPWRSPIPASRLDVLCVLCTYFEEETEIGAGSMLQSSVIDVDWLLRLIAEERTGSGVAWSDFTASTV